MSGRRVEREQMGTVHSRSLVEKEKEMGHNWRLCGAEGKNGLLF